MSGIPPQTITDTLALATAHLVSASITPRLDAELLLAHVLGWNRARLLAEGRYVLAEAQQTAFDALIERRVTLEPIAYIVGHKEFYSLDFIVDRRVLVPRPETELLVERVLTLASPSARIADIGTGSGCIAITLAVHLPQASIVAVDASADALDVARLNVERHHVENRVRLAQGDLLAPLSEPVNMLVSNPPYTILADIDENVRRHEPRAALDGGPDGLEAYRRLLAQASGKLLPGGAVLLEIGATQGAAVSSLAHEHFPNARISVMRDLAGHDRVVSIETLKDEVS